MSDTNRVFTALNAHTADCGEPPDVTTDREHYFGFFQNRLGEQWVLVFDAKARRGQLRGGDCGWDQVFDLSVTEGGEVRGIPMLNGAEQD